MLALYMLIQEPLCYVISSFGLVYLTERFNNLGLLMIVMPIIIGYSLGISPFKKLEVEAGNYY